MKRIAIILALLLFCAAVSYAETYKWIDDQGVVNFTDNPRRVPSKYRAKVKKSEDITIRNPKVRQELLKQNERMRKNQVTTRRSVTAPDRVEQITAPPVTEPPAPPGTKQPVPAPLGDQPTPTPLGMKQPDAAPLGDQPNPTPPGMKQPEAAPPGDQPTPAPPGMEQPEPAR
jgi:hypothetical protein